MPASKVLQSAEKNGLPFDVELNVKLREKYNNLINEYNTKLRSIRTVQRYQNYIIKKRKEDYIETLESEIEELREEGKDRQVKTREQKLSRIIAGEYTTKAELKLIEEVNFSSQNKWWTYYIIQIMGSNSQLLLIQLINIKNQQIIHQLQKIL